MFFSINDYNIIDMNEVITIYTTPTSKNIIYVIFKSKKNESYYINDNNFEEFVNRLNEWQKQFIK